MLLRIRKLFSVVLIGLFGTLCLVPGLLLLKYDGDNRSATENRTLAAWPGFPDQLENLSEWPGQFERFVGDHFGLRTKLVRFYNLLHVKLGTSTVPRVLVGKHGWLFLEQTRLADSNRGAYPLSADQLEALLNSFQKRQDFLAAKHKQFIVFPVPDKNSLYPEFLPNSVKIVGESRFRQFRTAAITAGFHSVDSLAALEVAKRAGENIYYQTDSHWNCRGAWFAYLELMRAIRQTGYQGGQVLDESEVEFIELENPPGTDIVKNLLNLEGYIPEPYAYQCRIKKAVDIKVTRPSDGKEFAYIYAAPPGKEHRRYQRSVARDHSRVLIYRDSYANALVPFLIHSFDEVIYAAPAVMMGFNAADVEQYDPDLVIYEFVERGLFYPPDDRLLKLDTTAASENTGTANSRKHQYAE